MKRTIPVLIAAVAGSVLIASQFVPKAQRWGETLTIWFDILAGVAFLLGGAVLVKGHLAKISARQAGWGYSAITVLAFALTLVFGLFKIGVPAQAQYPNYSWSGEFLAEGGAFWYCYEYFFQPLTGTLFALLAFYVASAAFRAFRASNIESILLLGTALIILLGQTFAGQWLTSALPESLSDFSIPGLTMNIMSLINTAGSRAIMIGIALGVIALSLRVILGIDRPYLGSEEE